MSDVGAIVLTVGERTTGRALTSLGAQTLQVEDVVIVNGVSPFHSAFNFGAKRVSTPFFVQVDADMVLDRECVQLLRDAMAPRVGIAVGALRDPLMGKIAGVKMFRRSCVEAVRVRDTIGPDTDLYLTLGRLGWLTRCLTGHGRRSIQDPTLGAHRPDYTADYVFGTYYLLGRRYAHREEARALKWRFAKLRRSAHPMAPVARMAMARGVLGVETRDMAKPRPGTADSAFLRRLTARSPDAGVAPRRIARLIALAIEPLFDAFYGLGVSLRIGSPPGLRACLRALGETDNTRSLLAEVALGGGALATSPPSALNGMPVAFERLAEAWAADDPLERAA